MITDTETLNMKKKILEEIASLYEKLLKEGKLAKEKAPEILTFVETKISPAHSAKEFSRVIFEFCEEFPLFESIATKLHNLRNEILQKIGNECLENLMEKQVELWTQLIEKLNNLTEDKLLDWIKALPPETRAIFMQNILKLAERVV